MVHLIKSIDSQLRSSLICVSKQTEWTQKISLNFVAFVKKIKVDWTHYDWFSPSHNNKTVHLLQSRAIKFNKITRK